MAEWLLNSADMVENSTEKPNCVEAGNFVRTLSEVASEIDKITRNSENDFLKIGENLAYYLKGTNGLYETAVETAESISQKILKDGINPLSDLMNEFSSYLALSSNEFGLGIKNLGEISAKIEQIADEQSGFNKIVKHLKMLGISTKIESVRLGSDDQGFYSLAENVDKLSSQISDKSKSILDNSIQLIKTMNSTIADMRKLEAQQKEQSNAILNHTTSSIEDLKEKFHECSEKAEKISVSSQLVGRSISTLVTSIQFHDITRQQMEHVKEALEGQIKAISDACRDENNEELEEVMELLPYACELQSAQVKSSVDQFYSAVEEIVINLREIENNVGAIFNESCALINEKEGKEESSLKVIKKELSVIAQSLKKNEEISANLSNSIISVVSIVDELSSKVIEIQSIGDEIEIIALNSRVKAARTGNNGSALGVLSEAIQKLSIEAKNQTVITTSLLETISESSEKLKASIESFTASDAGFNVDGINGKIMSLIESTLEIESEASRLVGRIKSTVYDLKENINKAVSELTIHEFVKETGNRMQENLNKIAALGSNDAAAKERSTKHLFEKYTMHSERAIHQNFTGTGNNAMNLLNDDNSGFDDNIELF